MKTHCKHITQNFFVFLRLWLDDKAHGEGRMIYENGDVYEGFWFMGQRSGYGILTRYK